MRCEVCGEEIIGKPCKVLIEGVEVLTCKKCSKFGKPVINRQPRGIKRKLHIQREEPLYELEDGYGAIIRRAREKLGLTQEELAKKLKEKLSVIQKLEAEKITPDEKLIKKIEKMLSIKITKEIEEKPVQLKGGKREALTIGDLLLMKKQTKD